jgi:hypothetical protein
MPILIMALAAFAAFLVVGGILFAAGMSERRQTRESAEPPASEPHRADSAQRRTAA